MKHLRQLATLLASLMLSLPREALADDPTPHPLSAEQIGSCFDILDALLPPKERFDMKDAPLNGKVVNPDGGWYIFNPKIYVPAFSGADFSQEFVDRLAVNHSRVMTKTRLNALPPEGSYRRVLNGRSCLPESYDIQWIHFQGVSSAEALIHIGAVGAASDHRIRLERTDDKWTVKENKITTIYD